MTQRIFNIENKKDMDLLWSILPDNVFKITKQTYNDNHDLLWYNNGETSESPFNINWHDKIEITRPIQEVTEQDIGKICMFNSPLSSKYYGILVKLRETDTGTRYIAQSCNGTHSFVHARRLTKQEIEELC